LDENDNSIEICDTRGLKKGKVTKEQEEDVQQRLTQLAILKLESGENDSRIGTRDINSLKRDETKK